MNEQIRVLVGDDHPWFRQGVLHSLGTDPGLKVVGATASGEDALKQAGTGLAQVQWVMHGRSGAKPKIRKLHCRWLDIHADQYFSWIDSAWVHTRSRKM